MDFPKDYNNVQAIIIRVCEEMCSKYCKYPELYNGEEWEAMLTKVCEKCPLNRL